MSAKTQAKVLRVLQEGEVERLGSARTIKVDVRVIAATNKNLEEEIEKGTFREDLYFRLAVIPIHVPPLRERPEDIPLLVRHYMDYFSRENNARPKRITPGRARRAAALSLEGQHPRAAQHRRAADHHDRRRHDRRRRSARRACGRRRGGRPRRRVGDSEAAQGAARCASSRTTPSARFWSPSCARTAGTSRRPPKSIDTPRSNLYKKLEQYQISQETTDRRLLKNAWNPTRGATPISRVRYVLKELRRPNVTGSPTETVPVATTEA